MADQADAERLQLLLESLADVQAQLDRQDAGWERLGSTSEALEGFTDAFRRNQAARATVAIATDPLIKRGVNLRASYVWGRGVAISVRDEATSGQDINGVVQAFLDDPANAQTIGTLDARMQLERGLCAAGEAWIALPTDPDTGRVRVRLLPPGQVVGIVTDPDDEATWWYVRREWTSVADNRQHTAYYPVLGYTPARQPSSVDGVPVLWGQPVRPVLVNRVGQRGMGDVFAALPWSSAYSRFLESWAKLMQSLARYSWQLSTRGDRTAQAAARLAAIPDSDPAGAPTAGLGVTLTPGDKLEAISKTGASFDADSGRPLAVMVAAALDIPVTTLLGDPGVTGARATAADVTDASWDTFRIRQQLWASALRDICGWVIDQAVAAPQGPLHGTVRRDGDRLVVELPAEDTRTVIVDWPDRTTDSLTDRIAAIQAADQSGKLPPLVVLREYLKALGIEDADEILADAVDDLGNFIPLDLVDEQTRERAARAGAGA